MQTEYTDSQVHLPKVVTEKLPASVRKRRKYEHIRVEYINGTLSIGELAKRHGIKYSHLQATASRERWTESRNEILDRINEITYKNQIDERVKKIKKFNDDCVKLANNILAASAKILNEEIKKEPPSAVRINRVARTIREAQMIGRLSLGVSTENINQTIEDKTEYEIKTAMDPKEAVDLYLRMIEETIDV